MCCKGLFCLDQNQEQVEKSLYKSFSEEIVNIMTCTYMVGAAPVSATLSLGTISFFENVPADELARLQQAGRTTTYTKGQMLFSQDDPAAWFYVVEQGWVKLFRETLDGDEVILDVVPTGSMLGEVAVFGNDAYPFGAEVVDQSKLTVYPLSILRQIIDDYPAAARGMLQYAARRDVKRDREIEHLTIMNAPQRIGCFLLRLCNNNKSGPVTLYLPYDKTLIASRLGMQPETFSRALMRLQEDTAIKVKGPAVEIESVGQLVTYVCKSCSNVFPCSS